MYHHHLFSWGINIVKKERQLSPIRLKMTGYLEGYQQEGLMRFRKVAKYKINCLILQGAASYKKFKNRKSEHSQIATKIQNI